MGGSGKRLKDLDKKEAESKPAEQKKEEKKRPQETVVRSLVRVSNTDLDGDKYLPIAILGIKGINQAMSRAICIVSGFPMNKRLKDMPETEIQKLEQIIKNPEKFGIPNYLLNRRMDPETGEVGHKTGADLTVATRFDVQRYVNLKTYRGWRHMLGQPVRGQRTRSKFRQKGRVVGVLRKDIKIATGATGEQAAKPAAAAAPAKEEKK